MDKLKYLEITYYKVIIDLLKTLSKYNFESKDIVIKIKNKETFRIEKFHYSNIEKLLSFYKTNAEVQETVDCEFGNDIYLDAIQFDSLLYNTNINFKILNASDEFLLRKTHLNNVDNYNERFINNQSAKLSQMLNIYGKIFDYVINTRSGSDGEHYSPCYAEKLWSEDSVSKNNYETILKYNFFDLKSQNISNADKEIINTIIL